MRDLIRPGLLALFAIASLVLGFLIPDSSDRLDLYARYAFAGIGTSFVLLAVGLWGVRCRGRDQRLAMLRRYGPPLALAIVLMTLAFSAAPPKQRIQYDESNLAAISFAMHHAHEVWVPRSGYYFSSVYQNLYIGYDKRPLSYPFLVYLTHSISGYRLLNGYAVNFAAGVGSLLLLFVLARRYTSPTLAWAGMILLAAYPMFVLSSASGGFEIVNLAFLLLTVLLLDELARNRDAPTAAAFAACLVVFVQCRYESLMFLLPGVAAAALLLRREEWKRLPLWTCLLPLVLTPLVWQNLHFLDSEFHQIGENVAMFSVDHFWNNLGRAWVALSGMRDAHYTLPFVLYLAILGYAWSLRDGVVSGALRESRTAGVCLFIFVSYVLASAVQFSYHMGDLSRSITYRLGVIYLPLLVFGVCLLGHKLQQRFHDNASHIGVAAIGAALSVLLLAWPAAENHQSLRLLTTSRYFDKLTNFLEAREIGDDTMVLAERAQPIIVRGWSAMDYPWANQKKDWLLENLENHFFQEILAAQIVDLETGVPEPKFRLDPGFHLQVLHEEQIHQSGVLRISRVLGAPPNQPATQ